MIKKRSFKAQYDLFNDSEIDMIECKLRMMGCRVVHGGDGRTLGEQHCTPRPSLLAHTYSGTSACALGRVRTCHSCTPNIGRYVPTGMSERYASIRLTKRARTGFRQVSVVFLRNVLLVSIST